ncbi:MAG: hypothetical protein ABSF03_00075 [Streptosporangiaceae bacterium]
MTVPAGAEAALALRPDFEYGVLAVDRPASVSPGARNGRARGAH